MSDGRAVRPIVAIVALVGSAACWHRHDPPPLMDSVIEERIVHGVVTIGQGADARLMLQTGKGSLHLLTTRRDSLALERVDGDEIAARVVEEQGGLRLERFTVLLVDGQPVLDGIVRADGSRFMLETSKGRVRLGNPPDAFKALVGARVWVAGAAETGPNRYGVIVP